MSAIKVNCENIEISNNNKICIIAGPCQLETEQHAIKTRHHGAKPHHVLPWMI